MVVIAGTLMLSVSSAIVQVAENPVQLVVPTPLHVVLFAGVLSLLLAEKVTGMFVVDMSKYSVQGDVALVQEIRPESEGML